MIYLKSFQLPTGERESGFLANPYFPTYHATLYPFQVFPVKGLSNIVFSDITIFSGGNGSGKSTLLNVICEKLNLKRETPFNKTALYDDYVNYTDAELDFLNRDEQRGLMTVSRIITSDDVFNHILKVRGRNEDIDFKRDVILEQRLQYRYDPDSRPREINLEDKDSLKRF